MDVIFDWNLGNMMYNGLITLRLYGFPFVEIGVVSVSLFELNMRRTMTRMGGHQVGKNQMMGMRAARKKMTGMGGHQVGKDQMMGMGAGKNQREARKRRCWTEEISQRH